MSHLKRRYEHDWSSLKDTLVDARIAHGDCPDCGRSLEIAVSNLLDCVAEVLVTTNQAAKADSRWPSGGTMLPRILLSLMEDRLIARGHDDEDDDLVGSFRYSQYLLATYGP